MMTGNEIRRKFLHYFADHDHTIVESSPLVPHDDPTLLFTNAGMVQFKRVFMGEEKRDYVRAATSQCCVRAGGKHNDLENVGYTARHHTFFEMLGNFSFGDYFKEEAVQYAWDFLTRVLGLPKEKLWVSVFEEDDEAYSLWEKVEGLPEGRIVRLGEKDNFWAMGDTGPCGPCSEILIDQGPEVGCQTPDCKAGCDCDRYLELWNLVFMQFYRDETGQLTSLPKPSIDTGMGLERIAAVVQGKYNNFDSDLFSPIIAKIAAIAGKKYGKDSKTDTAMRVIADHSRTAAFLVADGVLPSNEGRGYVLRRVMRRAIRYGRTLGISGPFLSQVSLHVVEMMHDAYPHLAEARQLLAKVVLHEEERFFETLDFGLAILGEEIDRLTAAGEKLVNGAFIFKLYDTYGFPVDIVRDTALEEGLDLDEPGYAAAMEIQREQSKRSWKGEGLSEMPPDVQALLQKLAKTNFVGYTTRKASSTISALLRNGKESVQQCEQGDAALIVCLETPFYGEAGGQIGDQGEIIGPNGTAQVEDTSIMGDNVILHKAVIIDGTLAVGDGVDLRVVEGRRQRIANNHTATHLLQAALRSVLGEHVSQSGSLVEPERLRFDFTHFSPLTREEMKKVEQQVNDTVRANIAVGTELLARAEAQKSGAVALFGEKYGKTVRVVTVGTLSKELCGGTHVGTTGEIGLFKIIYETGIAAGVRRIEAITGPDAFARFQQAEDTLYDLAGLLKTSSDELLTKTTKLVSMQKELEREVSRLNAKLSTSDLDSMLNNARTINNIKVIAATVPLDSPKTLREVGDRVRDRLGSGVAVLGGIYQKKAALLAIVSKDLTDTFHAGRIVKELAEYLGGSGGGRPDMAQAGGPKVENLTKALDAAYQIIDGVHGE